MRNLQFTFLLFCGIIFLKTESAFGQNLQFNQAIFNTYGPGNADGNTATSMFTGSLVVAANQVLKVTSGGCSSISAITSGQTIIAPGGYLSINDFPNITVNGGMEVWLPTGTYSIKGYEPTSGYTGGSFKGWVSGILYDIVP
jgi:hypothetical protein